MLKKKVEMFDSWEIVKNFKEEKDPISDSFQPSYFNAEVHTGGLPCAKSYTSPMAFGQLSYISLLQLMSQGVSST